MDNHSASKDDEPFEQSDRISIKTSNLPLFLIDEKKVRDFVELILRLLHLDTYQIDLSFVDENKIRDLNRDFRFKDSPTDVLSFSQIDFSVPLELDAKPQHSEVHNLLGDLVICLPVALKNASSIGHALDRETAFLIVHGILHLGGHDHESPQEEKMMTALQRKIFEQIDIHYAEPPPYLNMVVTTNGGSHGAN